MLLAATLAGQVALGASSAPYQPNFLLPPSTRQIQYEVLFRVSSAADATRRRPARCTHRKQSDRPAALRELGFVRIQLAAAEMPLHKGNTIRELAGLVPPSRVYVLFNSEPLNVAGHAVLCVDVERAPALPAERGRRPTADVESAIAAVRDQLASGDDGAGADASSAWKAAASTWVRKGIRRAEAVPDAHGGAGAASARGKDYVIDAGSGLGAALALPLLEGRRARSQPQLWLGDPDDLVGALREVWGAQAAVVADRRQWVARNYCWRHRPLVLVPVSTGSRPEHVAALIDAAVTVTAEADASLREALSPANVERAVLDHDTAVTALFEAATRFVAAHGSDGGAVAASLEKARTSTSYRTLSAVGDALMRCAAAASGEEARAIRRAVLDTTTTGLARDAVERATCRGVDIALVAADRATYTLTQHVRRIRLGDNASGMSEHLMARAEAIAKDAVADRLALFVGSGASVNSGIPDWQGLIAQLVDECDINDAHLANSIKHPPASLHLTAMDQATLVNRHLVERARADSEARGEHDDAADASKILGERVAALCSATAPSLQTVLLASLPFRTCATTNYDRLIEIATEAADRGCDVLPYSRWNSRGPDDKVERRSLLKLHGCIWHPHDIILTREQYAKFDETRAALAGVLQNMLLTKRLLFVGFSLTDENFHRILHTVRTAMMGESAARLRRAEAFNDISRARGGAVAGSRKGHLFGTRLSLRDEVLSEELWCGELEMLPMITRSEFGTLANSERCSLRLEAFLDEVGSIAAQLQGRTYVLAPDFADVLGTIERSLFTAEDRALRELLLPLTFSPDSVQHSTAWRVIQNAMDVLAHRPPTSLALSAAPPRSGPLGDSWPPMLGEGYDSMVVSLEPEASTIVNEDDDDPEVARLAHPNAGHLLIVRADVRTLDCDAFLAPTNASLRLSRRWYPHSEGGEDSSDDESAAAAASGAAERIPPRRAPSAGGDETECVVVGGRVWPSSRNGCCPPPAVWCDRHGERPPVIPTDVASHEGSIDVLLGQATNFVRYATQALRLQGERPRNNRRRFRFALPVIGTGKGGLRKKTGEVLRRLVPHLQRIAADSGLGCPDIVLVARRQEMFVAAQRARTRLPGLSKAQHAVAIRLARLAEEGALCLVAGSMFSTGCGVPLGNQLAAAIASRAEAGTKLIDVPQLLAMRSPKDALLAVQRIIGADDMVMYRAAARALDGDEPADMLFSPGHSMMASLANHTVVTMSPDTRLQRALRLAENDFSLECAASESHTQAKVVRPRWERPLNRAPGCVDVIEPNGAADHPASLELTREDDVHRRHMRATFEAVVEAQVLVWRHVLFVGFSDEEVRCGDVPAMEAIRRTCGMSHSNGGAAGLNDEMRAAESGSTLLVGEPLPDMLDDVFWSMRTRTVPVGGDADIACQERHQLKFLDAVIYFLVRRRADYLLKSTEGDETGSRDKPGIASYDDLLDEADRQLRDALRDLAAAAQSGGGGPLGPMGSRSPAGSVVEEMLRALGQSLSPSAACSEA